MDNKIGMVSVNDLKDMSFVIPKYQRGYRWESQQIIELLKDISIFMDSSSTGFYCLQPLAVKKKVKDIIGFRRETERILKTTDNNCCFDDIDALLAQSISWEVIDGQQRLTTMFILLRLLDDTSEPYTIEYETRPNSKVFLKDILKKTDADAEENIDFRHMYDAMKVAQNWFDTNDPYKEKGLRTKMLDTLRSRVKFIWYESVGENPIKVFTRLNIGKIALTNAELIKASLLNKSNYLHHTLENINSIQVEIANKWDEIEYALQNNELWLFLNSADYDRPTRIDFLFEIIKQQDLFNIKYQFDEKQYSEIIGNDRYSVYRYFAAAMEYYCHEKTMSDRLHDIWMTVVTLYETFFEWFTDQVYYHLVGFLIWNCEDSKTNKCSKLIELYRIWKKSDKHEFTCAIIEQIKKIINTDKDSLNTLHFEKDKAKIRKLLLLHNLSTVMASQEIQQDKYELHVFYKFPFHIFKRENWNVEHIDSATTNDLKSTKQQKAWARAALCALGDKCTNKIKQQIGDLLKTLDRSKYDNFEQLYDEVKNLLPKIDELFEGSEGEDNERMHPWNLTLLDEGTNKAYKNSIFSVKRSFIIYKEKGYHCFLGDDGEVQIDKKKAIAFVPPCTKQVFMKYYTPEANNLLVWGKKDSENYLKDMLEKLKPFLKS